MLDLTDALRRLYASEINVSLSCFWDSGWDAKLGDEINGFKTERAFHNDEIAEIAPWLVEQACQCWPESQFAKDQRP